MAATYNFVIERGATFAPAPIVWKHGANALPVDLTGYTARLQVRESVTATDVLLELSTANGGISITPLEGSIALSLSATATAAITWVSGVYDLELTSSTGFVRRLLKGKFKVTQEVTRD